MALIVAGDKQLLLRVALPHAGDDVTGLKACRMLPFGRPVPQLNMASLRTVRRLVCPWCGASHQFVSRTFGAITNG